MILGLCGYHYATVEQLELRNFLPSPSLFHIIFQSSKSCKRTVAIGIWVFTEQCKGTSFSQIKLRSGAKLTPRSHFLKQAACSRVIRSAAAECCCCLFRLALFLTPTMTCPVAQWCWICMQAWRGVAWNVRNFLGLISQKQDVF